MSQQTVQAYEVGRRRIQISALPLVARTLGGSRKSCSALYANRNAASAGRCRSSSAAGAHRRTAQAKATLRGGDAGSGAGPGWALIP
ncbi:hypothetical protein [Massilia agilis]|uniref:hypothetical protein n=1 Tax=Massilia agilis TaxID=1811226 RepID=UPI00351DA7AC